MNEILPTYYDDDPMPFGKYKNELLQDVPVNYLHWLYHEATINDRKLANYLENNIEAFKMENKDLIWTKKK